MRGMRKDLESKTWSTNTVEKTPDPNDPATTEYHTPDPGTDDSVSTSAVLYLTVPASGICSGKVLLFHKGLMYFGTSTGMVERRAMKITMLSELSHYTVLSGAIFNGRTGSVNYGPDSFVSYGGSISLAGLGVTSTPRAMIDLMLAGQIDLSISMDYFTGLINVDGFANYVEVGTPEGNLEQVRRSILKDIVIATGSGQITSNDVLTTIDMVDQNRLIQQQSTSVVESAYRIGVKLKATGARQTTDTTAIPSFTTPAAASSWQIAGGT